jgi:hypothetical protein
MIRTLIPNTAFFLPDFVERQKAFLLAIWFRQRVDTCRRLAMLVAVSRLATQFVVLRQPASLRPDHP